MTTLLSLPDYVELLAALKAAGIDINSTELHGQF